MANAANLLIRCNAWVTFSKYPSAVWILDNEFATLLRAELMRVARPQTLHTISRPFQVRPIRIDRSRGTGGINLHNNTFCPTAQPNRAIYMPKFFLLWAHVLIRTCELVRARTLWLLFEVMVE